MTTQFEYNPLRTVYLAGPITGLTHDEARFGWRRDFNRLLPAHIRASSPMRAKEFLKDSGILESGASGYRTNPIATPEGITTRDYNDVRTCDAMVACYLEGEGRESIGTAVEFGYAWAHQKPIVVIGSPDDVNIQHLMLERMRGYLVGTLEEGAHIISHLLTPGL